MKYSDLDFTIRKNKCFSIKNELNLKKIPIILPQITNKRLPIIETNSELNFFQKIHITEPQHSSIIGDLLNPFGTHHQGDAFLKLFFQEIGLKYRKEEHWTVSVELERFDIRIATKSRDKIIIIENKSNWADDRPNQLYRYWFYGIYLPQKKFFNNRNCYKQILYLSPSDFKSPSEQTLSRPIDFDESLPDKVPIKIDVIFFNNEIVNWLSKCLESVREYPELYYFIKQYYDFWR